MVLATLQSACAPCCRIHRSVKACG